MKKWVFLMGILAVCSLLTKTPGYWDVFAEDERKYESVLFYGVIREEYLTDEQGRKMLQAELPPLEDGDILVTDSTYCLLYRHGHAAIVVDASRGLTLESYGVGTRSRLSAVSEWRRYPHVLVLRLDAPKEVRSAIAGYAKEKMTGLPYRLITGMVDDKDMKGNYWGTQCAHLVWAAFDAMGYDIDGDGGWLVTPADFTKSGLLRIVPQE